MITPIQGLTLAQTNNWYSIDTGMDMNVPVGTPVRAVADGMIIYAEFGHTEWSPGNHPECPHDTPGTILFQLAIPQDIEGVFYSLVWYTHLSKLRYAVRDGGMGRRVKMGEIIGWTGTGNNSPHLHFGILTSRAQGAGDYMPAAQVAKYMRKLIRMGKNK
jgi:murein DD-endopeptidase MepM/ murein hydrolase activator NlpD